MRVAACVAFLALSATAARAVDWYTGAEETAPARPQPPTVAIDLAFDGTSQSAYSGALIGTIAPFAPLAETGLRLRIGGFGGSYVYTPYEAYLGQVRGAFEQGEMLVGYEWVDPRWQFSAFGGFEVSHDGITPNDPDNTVKGTHGGLKIGSDLYARPNDFSMISAVGTYSTDHNAYYARVKFGLATPVGAFVGPEMLALGDDFFHQWRGGVHLSGLQVGPTQFGVSGGYLQDQVRGPGGYGLLDARLKF